MKAIKEGHLPEQDGHSVWYGVYGNPTGPAIVSLHGGPGGHSKSKYLRLFDLSKYRVVIFDQRGCGKSLPLGEIKENTTQKSIGDIEKLREELGIETWVVSGGSWGSTLGLAYAQAHPKRVRGLLLSGIWLASKREIEWGYHGIGGVERLFPDAWERRLTFLSRYGATPTSVAQKLLPILLDSDLATQQDIAAGVANWETNLFSSQTDVIYAEPEEMTEEDIAGTKIFLHYEANDFFFEPDEIISNAKKICDIPTILVQGRYDVICPVENMWKLSKGLNRVQTVILPSSGHKLTAEGEQTRKEVFKRALEDWIRL